jgi:hypothetical protein
MKRVYLLVSLLAVAAGSLCANSTLNLACTGMTGLSGLGTVGSNGCFTTNFATVTSLDSLNWGWSPSAVGESGFGAAVPSGTWPYAPVTTLVPAAAALSNDDPVAVSIPGATGASVTRANDLAYQWEGPLTGWSSAAYAGVSNFAGHFTSAGSTTDSPGDALIEDTSGTPLKLSLLGASAPVLGIWFEIASLSGTNSTFGADVQAFDKNGNPLGTYVLSEGVSGYGSGGACQGLTVPGEYVAPLPCNDAPYVGFFDPQGRIGSVYISVFNVGSPTIPIGFAIDSLYVDESSVPEPAIPLLIGTGLAAMALYRRKRHARVG